MTRNRLTWTGLILTALACAPALGDVLPPGHRSLERSGVVFEGLDELAGVKFVMYRVGSDSVPYQELVVDEHGEARTTVHNFAQPHPALYAVPVDWEYPHIWTECNDRCIAVRVACEEEVGFDQSDCAGQTDACREEKGEGGDPDNECGDLFSTCIEPLEACRRAKGDCEDQCPQEDDAHFSQFPRTNLRFYQVDSVPKDDPVYAVYVRYRITGIDGDELLAEFVAEDQIMSGEEGTEEAVPVAPRWNPVWSFQALRLRDQVLLASAVLVALAVITGVVVQLVRRSRR